MSDLAIPQTFLAYVPGRQAGASWAVHIVRANKETNIYATCWCGLTFRRAAHRIGLEDVDFDDICERCWRAEQRWLLSRRLGSRHGVVLHYDEMVNLELAEARCRRKAILL